MCIAQGLVLHKCTDLSDYDVMKLMLLANTRSWKYCVQRFIKLYTVTQQTLSTDVTKSYKLLVFQCLKLVSRLSKQIKFIHFAIHVF
jgi:hypothetical protein